MLQIKVHSRYNFITFAKMKQWLMILALCWAAATVNAAGESQSRTLRAEITAAGLSQAEASATQGISSWRRPAGTPAPAIRIRPHRPSENAAYARPAYAGPIGIFII